MLGCKSGALLRKPFTRSELAAALQDYMRFANIREMHQPSAVGVAKSVEMDDKGTFISAHVVDDNAWSKVKAGVYKGFSIGGKAIEKVDNVINALRLTEISLVGGGAVTPEYLTLLIGLVVYTSGYIAEVVRSGLQSVALGQHEAALALGLPRAVALRWVQGPQALRVIIPPLTSQYLNLIKNSSLAVAVGYPDLVSIGSTSLNQTANSAMSIWANSPMCFPSILKCRASFFKRYP